ncbi:SGNH/GDSL hydrolase family protein [Verrucomicrobiales bacterium]|nr:SGNH/GDSL hydrolase family protein [Verrucomicrobiales bacterium]MDB4808611.1 SGNH/GDSL hydrolase family protein [Verrucomicrobiales bacterium]
MDETSTSKLSVKRRWMFRVMALVVGVALLALLEFVLVIGGWGTPSPKEDPFAGFGEVVPLFELNEAGDAYEILSQSRKDWFYPQSFPATKDANTYRIFVLGGSTVAGRPYTVETAFSSWLQLFLQYADPSKKWEVVNCGGVSYASYRLVPILEEVLENYTPDLVILYTGQNEFLEDRTYAHLKNLPLAVTKPYALASRLRLFNVIRSGYWKMTGQVSAESIMETRAILPAEVDALLEHEGGMEHYYRDDDWHSGVIDHYRFNLDRMCAATKGAGVPMILMNPAENLRGQTPFKSEHRAGLTEDERDLFYQHLAEGRPNEALKIDDLHADAHYQFAKKLEVEGDMSAALGAYVRAKDEDVCPLRMLESMHAIVKEVAKRHQVDLVDVRKEIEVVALGGIPGNPEFLDHVHPTIGGHQFFAKLLFEKMDAMGEVTIPSEKWMTEVGPALHRHTQSLGSEYFRQGEVRLENLRQWARGRSTRDPPVESKRK